MIAAGDKPMTETEKAKEFAKMPKSGKDTFNMSMKELKELAKAGFIDAIQALERKQAFLADREKKKKAYAKKPDAKKQQEETLKIYKVCLALSLSLPPSLGASPFCFCLPS